MLIKPAKFKKVKKVVTERVSDDIYGCDNCKKELDFNKPDLEYLRLTVFYREDKSSESMEFCSWKCVLEKLPKIKTDYFIHLPFLLFDTKQKGISAKDFLKLLTRP
jgi:hypothetical protein